MNAITNTVISDLLRERDGPCLSLYQRTHRHHPDNTQDPIRFGNLVKEIELSLGDCPPDQRARLLEPLYRIRDDADFWQKTLDGLVILGNPNESHVFHVPRTVPDFAVVADSWHLKPLLRIEQTTDRFHVLCLTREWIRLYEGNRDGLGEIDITTEIPATIEAAFGSKVTEPYQKVSSYGMGPAGGSGSDMRHGHGGKKDEIEKDTERFFRVVDRALTERYSRPSGLPMILAALPEYQGEFRSISQNSFLMKEGIPIDPGALSANELKEKAWDVIQPVLQQKIQALVSEFDAARAKDLASDGLSDVLTAAYDGRVNILLVEAGRKVPGHLNHESKEVELADDFTSPNDGDVLDDMVELVLRQGGTARIIPKAVMPTDSGIAATYRY